MYFVLLQNNKKENLMLTFFSVLFYWQIVSVMMYIDNKHPSTFCSSKILQSGGFSAFDVMKTSPRQSYEVNMYATFLPEIFC